MTSSLVLLIRQRLARYLDGETSLPDFNAWFVPATWNVGHDEDPSAYDRTNELYLRLAEHANGHWTEAELKDHVRPMVDAAAVAE